MASNSLLSSSLATTSCTEELAIAGAARIKTHGSIAGLLILRAFLCRVPAADTKRQR